MKILFICKHNRFRSKAAEAIFNKLNKDKKVSDESAGIITDGSRPYISNNVIKIMKEKGYDISGKPCKVDLNIINEYDILIIVADNVDKRLFDCYNGKVIQWKIPDADESEYEKIKLIINKIEKEIKNLLLKI